MHINTTPIKENKQLNIQQKQKLPWFSRLLWHSARKRGGLILQRPRAPHGPNRLVLVASTQCLNGDIWLDNLRVLCSEKRKTHQHVAQQTFSGPRYSLWQQLYQPVSVLWL